MNEIVNDRDMFYGGYYQNTPCNMQYGNFSFQGMPGSLMNNGMFPNMMNNYPNTNIIDLNGNSTNPITELNTRLTNLETKVRLLEQKIGSTNNSYQEDSNSMYMI